MPSSIAKKRIAKDAKDGEIEGCLVTYIMQYPVAIQIT